MDFAPKYPQFTDDPPPPPRIGPRARRAILLTLLAMATVLVIVAAVRFETVPREDPEGAAIRLAEWTVRTRLGEEAHFNRPLTSVRKEGRRYVVVGRVERISSTGSRMQFEYRWEATPDGGWNVDQFQLVPLE
jgi:hypothetical protein